MQNASIKENTLKNALFDTIIHSTENAILSKTLDGKITSWNAGAEKLFGYTAEEMMGQSCSKIVPDDCIDAELEILESIRNGKISPLQLPQKTKNGDVLYILWTVYPIRDENERIIGICKIAQDITERNKAEEQQKFLLKLSDAIQPLADSKKIQEYAARILGEHLKVNRCYYTEIEANDQYCQVLEDYYNGVPGMDRRFNMESLGKIWLDALRSGQSTLSEDVKNEPGLTSAEKEAVLGLQIASHFTVPLLKNGRLTALFSITDNKPRRWSNSDTELLKKTADRTWSAVERAKAEEALRQSEEKYRKLFDSIDEGVSTCEVIFDENQQVVDFSYLDINAAFMQLPGFPGDVLGKRYLEVYPTLKPYFAGHYERVLKTGVPERYELSTVAPQNNWYSSYTTRLGGESSRTLITVFSNITERKNAELRQAYLLKLSDALRNLTSSAAIQEKACQMLGKRLETTRALYVEFITNDGTEYAQVQGQYNTGKPLPSLPIPAENFKTNMKQYYQGNSTVINDIETEIPQEQHKSYLPFDTRSLIGVPLLKNGKPILVFGVHDNKPRQWTKEEIELVKETAERTWEAVERAKAEETLRINEERTRVQKEAIQSAIENAPLANSLKILSEMVINETAGEARTGFYIGNKENTELRAIRGSGNMPDSYVDQVDGFFIGSESLACGLAAYIGLPVIATDVKEDPLWQPWLHLAEQYNYRACWSFPIQTGNNKPMGTFVMYFKDPRETTAKELALADIAVQTAAVIISNHIEIQQRAEAEAALRKSEEQLELSISAGEIGIWNLDLKNHRLNWSKQQYELYGITEDEFDNKPETFWKYVNPTDRKQLQQKQENDFTSKSDIAQQFRITRKDGTERWIENRMKTKFDAAGNPESVTGVNIDITEVKLFSLKLENEVQKRTAEILRQKDFITTVLNSSPDLVVAFDTDCRILTFNKAYEDLYKVKEKDTVGKIYTDVFPSAKGQQTENDLLRAIGGEIIHNPVYQSPTTGRIFESYFSPLRDESEEIYAAIMVAHDITENIHALEKIKQSEEKFSKLFENSPLSISLSEAETGRLVDVNENYIELTGHTREEIIGNTAVGLKIVEKETREKIHQQLFKDGKVKNIEVEIKHKSGKIIPILVSIEMVMIENQRYFFHAFNNITELKKSQKVIEQKNKELERMNKELEAFNYVSSHDLQEPLRKIRTFASLLLEKENQNLSDTGKKYFNRMEHAAARMQILIQDLLTFSRLNTSEREFEIINFSDIIEDVRSEFTEVIAEKNAIIEKEKMCEIKIIPFQFRQLFHNLISNSLKFSKADVPAHITISCKKIINGSPLNDKPAYHIIYSDNGIGFEQHFAERVFQLFQRLHGREEYPGTGIGLAIVKKIVENHKGLIMITSQLDQGTKFDIYIPI